VLVCIVNIILIRLALGLAVPTAGVFIGALVAAVGVCAGLHMRKHGRAKEAQISPAQTPSVAPTTQMPPMAPQVSPKS